MACFWTKGNETQGQYLHEWKDFNSCGHCRCKGHFSMFCRPMWESVVISISKSDIQPQQVFVIEYENPLVLLPPLFVWNSM